MKILLKRSWVILSLFLVSLGGSLIFLLNTQAGLNLAIKAGTYFLPGQLQIGKAKGTLGGTAKFEHILYQDHERKVSIKSATFSWSPSALLYGQLQINTLETSAIKIVNKKHEKTKIKIQKQPERLPTLTLPKLPSIMVKRLDIPMLKVEEENKKTQLVQGIKGHLTFTHAKREGHLTAHMKAPVQVDAKVKISGEPDDYSVVFNLKNTHFDWELHGQGDHQQFAFKTAHSRFFGGQLNAQGLVTSSNWRFSIKAAHVDLSHLSSIVLNGTLSGEGNGSRGIIKLTLNQTQYYKHPFSGQARLDFVYPEVQAFTADFHSGNNTLQVEGQLKDRWLFDWSAKIPNLAILGPAFQGSLISNGNISGRRDNPTIKANLLVKHFKKEDVSIARTSAKLDFNLNKPEQPCIYLNLDDIQLGIYHIDKLHLLGSIESSDQINKLTLRFAPGTFQYPVESTKKSSYFRGGPWIWTFKKNTIQSDFDLELMNKTRLKGNLTLPNKVESSSAQKIKGSIEGHISHLDFLSELTSPTFRHIEGDIDARFNFSGTLVKPQITSAIILNASAFMPEYNLNLSHLFLNIQGKNGNLNYKGQVESDDTQLNLTGKTIVDFSKGIQSNFLIQSDRFLVTNTPEIKIYAAPYLKIRSDNVQNRIEGTVNIIEANIFPLDFSMITTLPEDVRFLNEKPSLLDQFSVESNILITLSDQVRVQYEGLSGNLKGQVRIIDKPGQVAMGEGQIRIENGTYTLRGRQFNLRRGFLNFNGPVANPDLEVQAIRSILVNSLSFDSPLSVGSARLVVGVNATGSLRRHRIKFFSEPAGLSQADILSYLLTGQPATSLTGNNLQLVIEAANSLGKNDSSNFTDQIRQGLGLSQFTIQEDDAGIKHGTNGQHTSLVLGKAITPRLFINYNVGLIQSLNTFKVRYLLWKNWILQGSSNSQSTGVDVIYSIER